MKRLFLFLMFAPDAEGTTGTTTATAQPESAELTALRDAKKAAWQKVMELNNDENASQKDIEAAEVAFWDAKQAIVKQQNAEKKAEADAKLAEARSQRKALNDNQLTAYAAHLAAQADKKASTEDKNAAYEAFRAAEEIVVRELMARYGTSTPAKKAEGETSNGNGSRGNVAKEIGEKLLAYVAEGKTPSEAVKLLITVDNYKRGTVTTERTRLKEAGLITS